MIEILFVIDWIFLMELIGLITFPLTISIFQNLPDKGYSISKILGFVLITYFSFILVNSNLISYGKVTAILSLLLVIIISYFFIIWKKTSKNIFLLLKSKNLRKFIIIDEIIFILIFFLAIWVRSYIPDIHRGEAPQDFVFINTMMKSPKIPPEHPWYSGESLGAYYYYFGHFVFAGLTLLSNIPLAITYNLSLATVFALIASISFGFGYNLTKKFSFSFLTLFFVTFLSNILGLLHILNTLVPSFNLYIADYAPLVQGSLFEKLVGGGSASLLWFGTRIITWTITEIPWFSLLWGDLHAHYVSFIFIFLFLFFTLNFFLSKKNGFSAFGKNKFHIILSIILISLSLGFLFPQFIWNYPLYVIFLFLAVFVHEYSVKRKIGFRIFLNTLIIAGIIFGLSVIFYYPTIIEVLSPSKGSLEKETLKTVPYHFMILMALSLFQIFIYLYYKLGSFSFFKKHRKIIFLIILVNILLISLTVIDYFRRPKEFWRSLIIEPKIVSIFFNFPMLTILVPIILISIIMILKLRIENREELFILMMIIFGAILVFFWELYNIRGRYVFIFKLFTTLWIFWSISAAYITYNLRKKINFKNLTNAVYTFCLVFLIISSSVIYILITTYSETNGFRYIYDRKSGTLNAIDYYRSVSNSDYQAILWFNENVHDYGVILESPGKSYSYTPNTARVSTFTGFPTVIGWAGHVETLSGSLTIERTNNVNEIYNTTDNQRALELLKKYNVKYIFVGELEWGPEVKVGEDILHAKYPEEGLKKFSEHPEYYTLLYSNPGAQIYLITY